MRKWIISDLHLGHKRILDFEPDRLGMKVHTVEQHDAILKERWHELVNKRDMIYVLGDVAFSTQAMQDFGTWTGRKLLVRGNHDRLNEKYYKEIFEKVFGLVRMKGCWLTHAPVHPQELRGRPNIHGHLHSNYVKEHGSHNPDTRYTNVCVEQSRGYLQDFNDVIEQAKHRYDLYD